MSGAEPLENRTRKVAFLLGAVGIAHGSESFKITAYTVI